MLPLVSLLLILNIIHTFFSVSIADLEQVKYILGMQKLEVYLEPSRTSMVEFFYENS